MKQNAIFPEEVKDKEFEMIEYQIDIIDFFPTNKEWLAFVKCLAEDNVEDLKAFSYLVDWKTFLKSRDVSGRWRHCGPSFSSSVAMCGNVHPFPTNPFFVAMFYNAKQCLLFMKESGVDFSSMTEFEFNAYHNLMGAVSFSSKHRFGTGSDAEIFDLIDLFHKKLFDHNQQAIMLQSRCCAGMMPLSWGVYLGLANYVEYIIYYHTPQSLMKSEAVGITEHITLDVSDAVGENPCYFTSPLCVLHDLYGESTLQELKKLGIFQHGFIWKQWVELLFDSNKFFIYSIIFLGLLLTTLTVVFSGPKVNDYLKLTCAGSTASFPVGTLVMLTTWIAVTAIGIASSLFGIVRKEYIRNQVGYPKWPRQYYWDLLTWTMPNVVAFPAAVLLLWIYVDAKRTCDMFSHFIYTASGLCNIILLLASVCILVCYLRVVPFLTALMSSFYNSLAAFTLFIILYLALMAIFSRMFQSSFIFSSVNNSTSRSDTFPQFLVAFYQTFLVSLNIVDSSIFIPQDDRIDLNVTHMFYILFVPILFINFVVGLLSSVVSRVLEHEVENRYILMLSTVDFAERTLAMVRKLCCRPRSIVLRLCEPLTPQSKLIVSNNNLSLASMVANRPSMTDLDYFGE